MAHEETFDLNEFGQRLRQLEESDWQAEVSDELGRARGSSVRGADKRFAQQMYITRLERLARALRGEDVSKELTPSERAVYGLLFTGDATAAESSAAAATAPAPAPSTTVPEPEREPTGQDRRVSRRIRMATKARVRREKDDSEEVVDPSNVSRGGIAYLSSKKLALHEIVWVALHYQPDLTKIETRGIIVRAAPIESSSEFSYGVKFL